MEASEALKKLFADRSVTLANGEKVSILVVNVKTLGPALDLLHKVIADLGVDVAKGIDIEALMKNPLDILKLISKFYDEAVAVAAMHTSLTIEQFQALGLDDAVPVFHAVIAVNKDFFTSHVLPAWAKLQPKKADSAA